MGGNECPAESPGEMQEGKRASKPCWERAGDGAWLLLCCQQQNQGTEELPAQGGGHNSVICIPSAEIMKKSN